MIVEPSGLSWWQSWLCVWLGYSIAACFVCLTGRIGATYHISFPVASRSSFGIWGALWPVFNRAAMACIWYGVQAWIGGECVKLIISGMLLRCTSTYLTRQCSPSSAIRCTDTFQQFGHRLPISRTGYRTVVQIPGILFLSSYSGCSRYPQSLVHNSLLSTSLKSY